MVNKKIIVFIVLFGILTVGFISTVFAVPFPYVRDPFTLTWTTVTNAIALDQNNDGYADQLYQYTSSPPNVSFTKILGNGSSSGTVTLPNTGGGQHILSKFNVDDKIIYVGGYYGSVGTSSSSIGKFNISTGTTSNNLVNFNYTDVVGSYAGSGISSGYTGVSNEPVLVASFLAGTSGDYNIVKNSTKILFASGNDIRSQGFQQDNQIKGFFIFNSTKFYYAGTNGDRVYQYTFNYPHEHTSTTYDNISLNISAQSSNPNDIEMSSDGTKLYVLDDNDNVYQYNGTSAGNLSTFSYGSKSKNLTPATTVDGLAFKTDGTKMYTNNSTHTQEWSLSQAWNVATATKTVANVYATGSTGSIQWKPDGTKLWSTQTSIVREHNCSTAWLLSSCSFSISYNPVTFTMVDFAFTTDGMHLYSVNGGVEIDEIQIATPYTISGANIDLGSNFHGISPKSIYTDSDNTAKHYYFNGTLIENQPLGVTNNYDTGMCSVNGCLVKVGTTAFTSMKPLTTFTSNGAVVDSDIQLYHAGLELPTDITNRNTYWHEYLPTPSMSDEDIIALLHYNILNPALTSDAYRFLFNNGTHKYIMYVTGTSIAYAPYDSSVFDNRSVGYYIGDTIVDAFDTALTTAVIPVTSFDIVTPTTRLTESFGGLFSLISGYQAETASTVVRMMNSEITDDTTIYSWTIGLSASQTQLTILIRNAPTDGAIMVQDPTNKLLTEKFKWSIDYIKADKTFSVDLPYPKCVDIYIQDLSLDVWDYLGNICNTGTMPKTLVYSANLSFTFYSLEYGVAHTFAQETNTLQTKVRHNTLPFDYTVKIYDSTGALQYDQLFTENSTNIDIQSINSTGISLPAMLRVYDVDNNQLYYASLGSPSYLSQTVAWFNEWMTIDGFNLLFMLPIVFGAMFTRNTVGIGTMSTVALISVLAWFGVVPIPDIALYLMIFISVIGVIAYKQLYN